MIVRRLKIEPLERRLLLAADFGDAPEPYDTLLADNGARHIVDVSATTLYLGAGVDAESDATPHVTALGDDQYSAPGVDDENGLVEPARDLQLTLGTSPRVRVRATNSTGAEATLYGWIDYNQDGVFDNSTERASVIVPTGTANAIFTIEFPAIPTSSPPGQTFARFRLSTDAAAANPTGAALDGEVEDYAVAVTTIAELTGVDPLQSKKIGDGINGGPSLTGNSYYGSSIAVIGDVDGDGIEDIAVGAPGTNSGSKLETGSVYIHFMNGDGTSRETVQIGDLTNGGAALSARDKFGTSVASLGDLDGNGVPDLAVGAPGDDTERLNAGAVHVLFLNQDGTVANSALFTGSQYGGDNPASGEGFGTSVANMGDLDGNGIVDLAVGAPRRATNDFFPKTTGAVHLIYLSAEGSVIERSRILGESVGPFSPSNAYGSSVSSLGDLDGDGISDLAVGAINQNGTGAVHILFLTASPYSFDPVREATLLTNSTEGPLQLPDDGQFGISLAAMGDLDGDGVQDLAVGGEEAYGSLRILFLNANGQVRQTLRIADQLNGGPDLTFLDHFGSAVAVAGDLDGDGVSEIFVGASQDTYPQSGKGAIHLLSLLPDTTGPTIVSFLRDSEITSPTNADLVRFRAEFSEDVLGVDASDFKITGGSTAQVVQVVELNPNLYELTVNGGDLAGFNGLLGIDLVENATISDRIGNQLADVEPVNKESYVIDNIPPALLSIVRVAPTSAQTSQNALRFRATFGEAVYNVDASDFVVAGAMAMLAVQQTSAVTYDITVSGGNLPSYVGAVGIDIAASQDIADLSGVILPLAEPPIDEIFDLVLSTLDFADAPDSGPGSGPGNYQTTLANNGPRHTVVEGLRLGANVDEEPDAIPNIAASGDDQFVPQDVDDEDGVVEAARDLTFVLGSSPRVRVRATNTTDTEATLHGWIDYNQDGVFDNILERASIAVPAGTANQVFTIEFPVVPASSATGNTYARFRLSTDPAAANPTGLATDGEVEDYQATVLRPTEGQILSTRKIAQGLNGGPVLSDSDSFGSGLAGIGDLDGDGVADMAVGAVGDDTGGVDRGAVHILFMSGNGSVRETAKISHELNGGPLLPDSASFGAAIANIGDVNGDGVSDIAVGAPGEQSSRGAVYILLMDASGTVRDSVKIGSAINGGPVLAPGDSFGTSITHIGDLNGDGIGEIAVGAHGDDTGGNARGAIYILFIDRSGTVFNSVKLASGLNGNPALANGDIFGTSIASLGDLDGDGVSDLAVGARGDSTGGSNADSYIGSVHILFLTAAGTVRESVKLASDINGVPVLSNSDAFGSSLASLGDMDGDGRTELAVGAVWDDTGTTDCGALYVLKLRADGSVHDSMKIAHKLNGGPALSHANYFGAEVAVLGDSTPNGVIDIVVGSPGDGTGGSFRGAVHILRFGQDVTAPALITIQRQIPTSYITDADALVFRVSFTEHVVGVDPSDFVVDSESTAEVVGVVPVAGMAGTYDVTVSGGDLASFTGNVGLRLADVAIITDGNGNLLLHVAPTINEEYGVVTLGTTDFGDAPAPYPTALSSVGPVHGQSSPNGPRLGPIRDVENDGQPTLNADGEGADDDGVLFGSIQPGQLNATVTVNVQGAAGKLDAWVDFDGDGSWGGPGEQIFASQEVGLGDNRLTFAVPSWASSGATYARFRLSTTGGLGVTGPAANGEVEDYRIAISPPGEGGAFRAGQPVFTGTSRLENLYAADFDDDGILDLLTIAPLSDTIAWQRGDGNGGFTSYVITSTADAVVSAFPADLDGDGDLDVLSASYYDDTIAWYENDGNGNFLPQIISTIADGASYVSAADLDDDGDLDVLSASSLDDKIAWYKNDGSGNFVMHVVTTAADGVSSVVAADVDRDGDLDLVAPWASDASVAWYENDGNQLFTAHVISTTASGINMAIAADIDGDGDTDLLSSSSNGDKITWYENAGLQSFTPRVISTSGDGPRSIAAADLDGDGDLDVLATLNNDREVTWYENLGDGTFATQLILRNSTNTPTSAIAADYDGDGDLDVISSWDFNTPRIQIHENVFAASLTSAGGTISENDFSPVVFTFAIGRPRSEPTTLTFAESGLARLGIDYTLSGIASFSGSVGTVVIPAGETSVEVLLTPIDDALAELTETINLTLVETDDYLIASSPPGIWTLASDEFGADFGDAPAPYPTSLSGGGAVHSQGTPNSPRLGSTLDIEVAPIPSLDANADTDDDGVTFGTMRAGQQDASVIVNVQNAPLGAKLDAWIDFNGDGVWDTVTERIAGSVSVVNGANIVQFAVPANIAPGAKYARFRLSSAGGLLPKGFSPDGEVEDYRVTIAPALSTLGLVAPTEISITGANPTSIQAADLDGDGDQDFVFTTFNSIYWLERDSIGGYVEHLIAAPVNSGQITVADIDLDGDLDIIGSNGVLTWYENDGHQVFTSRVIDTPVANPTSVNLADLDNDGDWDIVAASPSLTIAWYENDGSMSFTERIVNSSTFGADGVHTVHPVDMDRDGDLDLVVGANGFFGEFAWYENNGSQIFSERTILPTRKPSAVFPVDFDQDGDIDIAYALNDFSSDSIGWLENNGSQGFTYHTISSDVIDPTSIYVADLNGDGRLDVLTSSSNRRTVDLFLGNGGQNYSKSALLDVSPSFNMAPPAVADFDGDGDLDILVGRDKTMFLFEAYPTTYHVIASHLSLMEDSATSSTITFTRTGDISAEQTFNFAVLGSATLDTDYTVAGATSFDATSGSITFLAGERTATLTVTPIADGDFEGDETIVIRIADYTDVGLPAQPTNPTDAVVTILQDEPADFGDAPETYLTTAANNGPSHGATGPQLGATRDSEAAGQPSPAAEGDGPDDDGITFGTLRAGQQDALLTINVQNAPAGARLDAWFDFNGDGNFLGPDEQVAVSMLLAEGTNAVPIDIPATARSGETMARFRLSTAGGLSYVGYSVDGEVEDYRVTISPPVAADGMFGARPPIADGITAVRSVATADLDGDGDLDVVSGGTGLIEWHENVGHGLFVTHDITTDASGANTIRVVDLDRDGDLDLIVARSNRIFWYENNSDQSFVAHDLTAAAPLFEAEDVHAADIDGDGDLDIVAFGGRTASDGTVVWFENYGDKQFSPAVTIANTQMTMAIALADVNADGHLDIVATTEAFPSPPRLALLLNDGLGNFIRNDLSSTTPLPNIASIAAVDLDDDGDQDIVFSSTGPLVGWYENNGAGVFSSWQIIDFSASITRVVPADVDGDGHTDLVAVSYTSSRAYWYKNNGEADPTFTRIDIAATALRPWSIDTGDLDGDGDLDVVTPAYTGNRIEWFESIPASSGDFDGDGDVDGRDFLAWQRGASPKPRASNDLADWQATYGYTAPEPPAAMTVDAAPVSLVAAVAALDEVLTESAVAPLGSGVLALPVSIVQQARPKELGEGPVVYQSHDRVFTELGTPSRTFVRDFGDIVTRRAVRPRTLLAASDVSVP